MTAIPCPKCRSDDWNAIEVFSCITPCTLSSEDGETVEVEFDPRAEMARDAATSVTTGYVCAREGCGHTIQPEDLNSLAGQR